MKLRVMPQVTTLAKRGEIQKARGFGPMIMNVRNGEHDAFWEETKVTKDFCSFEIILQAVAHNCVRAKQKKLVQIVTELEPCDGSADYCGFTAFGAS